MGRLTRDGVPTGSAGDDDLRPGTFTSDRGWTYRLLPSLETPGAWHIYPEAAGELAWLGPGWPGYLAVPQHDATYGYCHGYAIWRSDGNHSHAPVGYGENLFSICWPAEDDLIATMNYRPPGGGR